MKAFYTASSAFRKDESVDFSQKTVNYISFKIGKKNLKTSHAKPQKSDAGAIDKDIQKSIKEDEKAIRDCDVFVADLTKSSGGVGFQIAMALNERKPILAIRHKEENRVVSFGPISTKVHKEITYKEYDNSEEITRIIDEFLEDAKNKIDTKFILIIPPDIDKYLSWASDHRRMHKAQVVRNAIEGEMKKDKEWKEYMKELSEL